MEKEIKDTLGKKPDDTLMAALATLPLVGLVMYFGMKDLKPIVRHYARQSIGLLLLIVIQIIVWLVGSLLAFTLVAGVIGIVLMCIDIIFGLVIFVLWIMLLINALQGNEYKLPVVTDFVDNLLKE